MNASRGLRSNPRWEDDGETLVLEGHIVDAITGLSVRALGQDGDYRFRDVGQEDADDSEATKNAEPEGIIVPEGLELDEGRLGRRLGSGRVRYSQECRLC